MYINKHGRFLYKHKTGRAITIYKCTIPYIFFMSRLYFYFKILPKTITSDINRNQFTAHLSFSQKC